MNTNDQILERIKEIEEEYKSTPKPKLNPNSIENVDDAYQDLLEYNWWLRDLKEEYTKLNIEVGKVPLYDM